MDGDNKTTNNLIKQFLFHVQKYCDAIHVGDHKKANIAHGNLRGIFDTAKKNGVLDEFKELIDTNNLCVQIWVSIFLFGSYPELSKAKLVTISKTETIEGMIAETTLKIWEMGKIDFI